MAVENILIIVPGDVAARAVAAMGPPDKTDAMVAETVLEVELLGRASGPQQVMSLIAVVPKTSAVTPM